ncbi:MAG: glutathione S-transferase family protein [Candidatus Latescibacteria bacterium]|nr:glutathione S-transferase family protein [Candidatus Latescibacterota bacterium]
MNAGNMKAEIIGGEFQRQEDTFRQWVRRDGSGDYPAAAGRYHLYVSLACPWAHRTIITRRLLGLEGAVGMSVVDPVRDERGWAFGQGPGHGPDPVCGFRFLSEAYLASDPHYAARVTVPVLWDRLRGCIVNNDENDLMRIFNTEFAAFAGNQVDLYPPELEGQIEALNEWIYPTINDGVYRAGFATSQAAYERAVRRLFASLDRLEELLAGRRYLTGKRITAADWKLFPTLIRFDAVYHGHFKCNLRRLVDYPNLWGYVRDLYQQEGVAETVNFDHIKRHYYVTHTDINPTRIVPLGPVLDLQAPPGRQHLGD